MPKSRKVRNVEARPASAVDPIMLAHYRRAAREPDPREKARALTQAVGEYTALVDAGENLPAMGAAVELLDVVMRIATTPASDDADWAYKVRFFERYFPSMAETIRHPHAARVAWAVVNAERVLSPRGGERRH